LVGNKGAWKSKSEQLLSNMLACFCC